MKQILYFRHSLKAADGNLSPEGIELAYEEGKFWKVKDFAVFFHGDLPRTAETREHFVTGWSEDGNRPPESYSCVGPIKGVGSDQMFGAMLTPAMKDAVKGGMTNIGALVQTHVNTNAFEGWKAVAHAALKAMFDLLEAGQTGAAFGHSPIIELVALGCRPMPGDGLVVNSSTQLKEMDCITFEQAEDGTITYYLEPK